MLTVGLTGGIASGKSVVRNRLQTQGVPTLDADAVVHELFRPGTEVTEAIRLSFGDEVIARDGSVDRNALGRLVFADRSARKRLEAIVHPRVAEAIETFFEKARAEGAPLAVVDAALMVETGSFRRYDRIIVTDCPRDVQKARLMARDGLDEEEAERRLQAQMPGEEKRKVADYVIDTSGTMEDTLRRTDSVLERLRKEAG